jgi:hypothetical protein
LSFPLAAADHGAGAGATAAALLLQTSTCPSWCCCGAALASLKVLLLLLLLLLVLLLPAWVSLLNRSLMSSKVDPPSFERQMAALTVIKNTCCSTDVITKKSDRMNHVRR